MDRRWGALAGALVAMVAPSAHAATIAVDTSGDSSTGGACTSAPGDCTFREAIARSNALPGFDEITRETAGAVVVAPNVLAGELPALTDPASVDGGTTMAGDPGIELDGSGLLSGDGLRLAGGGTTVTNVIVQGFPDNGIDTENGSGNVIAGSVSSGNGEAGILLNTGGNTVVNSFIGTDPDGTADVGNTEAGVVVRGDGNVIGGDTPQERNVISGNDTDGVFVAAGADHLIEGNFIGTDVNGTADLGNDGIGVSVFGVARDTTLRGNLISGNDGSVTPDQETSGVEFDIGTSGNRLVGNMIGTDVNGAAAIPNAIGVRVRASGQSIGGRGDGEGNLISGNDLAGVVFEGIDGGGMEGNAVGLNADGTGGLPNQNGVILRDRDGDAPTTNVVVGGSVSGAGNTLSGNDQRGVAITTSGGGNKVEGNRIGTSPDGSTGVPNGNAGVRVDGSGSTIGGTAPGAGNTIAFNVDSAVDVVGGSGNAILGNTTHSNGSATTIPVDLANDGATANDGAPDGDSGPNDLQNHPDPLVAVSGPNGSVQGTLASEPNETYRIEAFTVAGDCTRDAAFAGAAEATTDASGNASFEVPAALDAGARVRVIATDAAGSSSEISACSPSGAVQPSSLSLGDSPAVVEGNSGQQDAVFAVTLSAPSPATVRVDYATASGSASSTDFEAASGTAVFAPGETSKQITVRANGDTRFEPDEDFFVSLSNPRAANIADAQGRGVIQNDDADDERPTVTEFRMADRFSAARRGRAVVTRVGTRVRYRISEPARSRFTIRRARPGRRVGGRCVRRTQRNRGRRRCTRNVRRGFFHHRARTGLNSFRFRGRIRGRKLPLGRYRMVLRATDAAGNRSRTRRERFRIVRRR